MLLGFLSRWTSPRSSRNRAAAAICDRRGQILSRGTSLRTLAKLSPGSSSMRTYKNPVRGHLPPSRILTRFGCSLPLRVSSRSIRSSCTFSPNLSMRSGSKTLSAAATGPRLARRTSAEPPNRFKPASTIHSPILLAHQLVGHPLCARAVHLSDRT